MTKRTQFTGFFLGLLVAVGVPALAATFNLFQPANGILKGSSSTYITTAATSSDVVATFSGTCNAGAVLKGDGTCGPAAVGTVTSVGLTAPAGLSVTGSPVTGSGTLGITTALNGVLKGNGSGFTTAAAADIYGLWSGTCNATTFLRGDGSCVAASAGGVTSVGLTAPAFLSVSGSPVTSTGTLALSYSGTALPVANGGTGVTSSTGTGSTVLSASPALTGTPTIGGVNVCLANGTNCPSATVPVFAYGRVIVTGGSSCAVSGSDANANISSCSYIGTGGYQINLTGFTTTPRCIATSEAGVGTIFRSQTNSTSNVSIGSTSNTGADTNSSFSVICIGT